MHCEYCFIQALLIYELIYTDKYGELSEEEMNNMSGENSDIKPDIRQLIGNASIMNASKNMLPDPSEGMNNNGNEPANTGNITEQQPNEVSPLNNEMREIESGNTSMNAPPRQINLKWQKTNNLKTKKRFNLKMAN